jgi:hypothetical protein
MDQRLFLNLWIKLNNLRNLNDMFTIFFGKNHGFEPTHVFNIESKILNAMGCEGLKENPEYRMFP